ncbi:4'-phosphopantetheinyl transferase superfamily protein [Nocardioides sp.]|uniref:4'-phosphopantetheinyl transferase family protein n=1 Tax=Nocardioides sp. TaxID=35761 RepID=UPI0035192FF9
MTVHLATTGAARTWHERLLSPEEQERARRFVRRQDRERFLVGAALLRLLLAERLDKDPLEVEVDRTCPTCGRPHWKPRIETNAIHCSVAHSGPYVLVALRDEEPIGVDVEALAPGSAREHEDIHQAVLAPDEPAPRDAAEFLRLWTRKEALLKLSGQGLNTPPGSIRLSRDGPPQVLSAPAELTGAVVVDLEIARTAVAALATYGPPPLIEIVMAHHQLAAS